MNKFDLVNISVCHQHINVDDQFAQQLWHNLFIIAVTWLISIVLIFITMILQHHLLFSHRTGMIHAAITDCS